MSAGAEAGRDHPHLLTDDDLERLRVFGYSLRAPQRERLYRLLLAYRDRDHKFRHLVRRVEELENENERLRCAACSVGGGAGEVTVVGWLAGPNAKRRPCHCTTVSR
jgi:hypothetical protein